jgi:Mrp family chromosome partitioning ATPase
VKASGEFRPLLEVDGFLWPKTVGRLAASTHEALEKITEDLLGRASRNQRVIGWQACRHGDGCSTLLLAAARHLAERGLKVALVDADFRHPGLARRVGLTPTSGWEEVAAGRLSLAEVMVESLRDGISLAPWCIAAEEEAPSAAKPSDPASALEALCQAYDIVLVDLGRGNSNGAHAELLASLRSRLDVVLVVHNVGEVPAAELNRVCQGLSQTGKAELAVVENFA